MKVEQAIVEQDPLNSSKFNIVGRVHLECEVVEPQPPYRTKVRILEAGAGLNVGDEIVVPTVKITPN